jgi:peptide/nickel transport system substrate-binding protein
MLHFLKSLIPVGLIAILLFPSCKPPEGSGDGMGGDSLPVTGDWIRLAIPNEPDNLHPHSSVHAMSTYIRDQMHLFLTDIHPKTLELEPVLVESLAQVSPDQLAYSYRIREEAKWDDGKPITGHDFAFSVKALVQPLTEAVHSRNYFSFISDVKVDASDPKKFTVITGELFFLAPYAIGSVEVVPKHLYDPKGLLDSYSISSLQGEASNALLEDPKLKEFTSAYQSDSVKYSPAHIHGAGPYKLESWTPKESIVLVRKKGWWGEQVKGDIFALKAYPDKIIYKPIKDRAATVQALAAGEVDVIWDVLPDEFDRIRQDSSDHIAQTCSLHLADSYSWTFVAFNTRPPAKRKPVVADRVVRRAIAHLADLDKIIRNVYNGYGTRIVGPISPFNKNEYHTGLKLIDYSVDRAAFLLDSAGWKDSNGNGIRDKVVNGRKVELEIEMLVSASSTTAPMVAEIIAQDALKAGVKINAVKDEFKNIAVKLSQHDFDMIGLGFNGGPLPADLKQVWHTENWTSGGSNYTGFGTAKTDSLIEKIRQTVDPNSRKPLYYALQEEIYREQPMIFMISPKERVIIDGRFRGQFMTTVRPGFKVRAMWVHTEKQKFGKPSTTDTLKP